MPQRFVEPHDRLVFTLIALWALFLGGLLLADTSANDEVWLPDLWPALMIAGGLYTLLYAVLLSGRSRWVYCTMRVRGLSNGLLVVGCVGRGFAAILGITEHTAESWTRAIAELAVFTMVGFLLYFTWRSRVPDPEGVHGGLD